jgi:hypothetical protein
MVCRIGYLKTFDPNEREGINKVSKVIPGVYIVREFQRILEKCANCLQSPAFRQPFLVAKYSELSKVTGFVISTEFC